MELITRRSSRPSVPDPDPLEVEALTDLWGEELRRGWIPTPADVADALGLIRSRRR